jgi:hypothetical protein
MDSVADLPDEILACVGQRGPRNREANDRQQAINGDSLLRPHAFSIMNILP